MVSRGPEKIFKFFLRAHENPRYEARRSSFSNIGFIGFKVNESVEHLINQRAIWQNELAMKKTPPKALERWFQKKGNTVHWEIV